MDAKFMNILTNLANLRGVLAGWYEVAWASFDESVIIKHEAIKPLIDDLDRSIVKLKEQELGKDREREA